MVLADVLAYDAGVAIDGPRCGRAGGLLVNLGQIRGAGGDGLLRDEAASARSEV